MTPIDRRKFIKEAISVTGGMALWSMPRMAFGLGTELDFNPYIIVVHCDGGWDPTMVFDNKNASTYIDTQSGQTTGQGNKKIPYVAHTDRPAVDHFFGTYGANACIVNGVYCGFMGHKESMAFNSGTNLPESNRYTDWLSFYASQVGLDKLFPHVTIDAPYFPGPYGKYTTRLTSELISNYEEVGNCPVSYQSKSGDASEKALNSYLSNAYQGLLENRLNDSLDSEKIQSLGAAFYKESSVCALVQGQKYGDQDSAFQRQCRLAARLISGGYSHVVSLQAGAAGSWDTHRDNFSRQSENFEMLFTGLNTLLEEAAAKKFIDKLTIIVRSELGRSPKLNSRQNMGKDHWPFTSTLLWGSGIHGGQTIGTTDDRLRGLPINPIFGTADDSAAVPLEHKHIMAALYNLYGVPSTLLLPDVAPASIILSTGS